MKCCYCGNPPDPQYREITGWEQLRAEGGANKIIARRETGRLICRQCMVAIRSGADPVNQMRLL